MKSAIHIFIAFALLVTASCGDDKIPTINIKKEGEIGWGKKEQCIIHYLDSENSDELMGNIKCRGGISSKYYKHSFSLELEKSKIIFQSITFDISTQESISFENSSSLA